MKKIKIKINQGKNRYKAVEKFDCVEYLSEASDTISNKNVIKKIIFIFLIIKIIFGIIIKKQHKRPIMGIYNGL